MKRLLTSLLLLSVNSVQAQYSYRAFDPKQDVQNTVVKAQHAGCACAYTTLFPQLKDVQVSPLSVKTTVGQPVEIRYDASGVCMGQTVRNSNGQTAPPFGTARWEVGAFQQLPDTYGIITYTAGYSQPRTDYIDININVQCYDTGSKCQAPNHYVSCPMSARIPVVITAASKAAKTAAPKSTKPSSSDK